jgi:hypothetical protein
MKIIINDHRKIFAVQDEFTSAFSNFRIEFFEKPHTSGGAPSGKAVKHTSTTLGQCRLSHNKGTISITPGMTAGELVQNFRDVYELAIQVVQKKGSEWLVAPTNTVLSIG